MPEMKKNKPYPSIEAFLNHSHETLSEILTSIESAREEKRRRSEEWLQNPKSYALPKNIITHYGVPHSQSRWWSQNAFCKYLSDRTAMPIRPYKLDNLIKISGVAIDLANYNSPLGKKQPLHLYRPPKGPEVDQILKHLVKKRISPEEEKAAEKVAWKNKGLVWHIILKGYPKFSLLPIWDALKQQDAFDAGMDALKRAYLRQSLKSGDSPATAKPSLNYLYKYVAGAISNAAQKRKRTIVSSADVRSEPGAPTLLERAAAPIPEHSIPKIARPLFELQSNGTIKKPTYALIALIKEQYPVLPDFDLARHFKISRERVSQIWEKCIKQANRYERLRQTLEKTRIKK